VTTPRPQPLLNVATVTGLITAAVSAAVLLGLLSQAEADAVSAGVQALIVVAGSALAAVAPVIAAFKARGKVTPTSDPRDDDGRQLVPLIRD
jgi:hypothetical protein